jgi:hypothetical protein
MRGAVMYGPGDVRVVERDETQVVEPDGRDRPRVSGLRLRLGSVAVSRDRGT